MIIQTKPLIFTKTRPVKSPGRGTARSAGIDFYVPEDYPDTTLEPNQSTLIPSGIRVRVPEGFALIAFNKSGVATKKKLIAGACVVDEDYTGEVHLHLINAGEISVTINRNEKILQFILVPVNYADVEEVNSEHYESLGETSRGSGGFGSTN